MTQQEFNEGIRTQELLIERPARLKALVEELKLLDAEIADCISEIQRQYQRKIAFMDARRETVNQMHGLAGKAGA